MSRGQRRCRRPVSRGGGSSPAAASRWGSGSAVRAAQAGAMAAVEEGKGPPPPPGTLTAGRDAPGAGAADPAERTPNPRTPGPRTRRQPPPHAHRAQEHLRPPGERERGGEEEERAGRGITACVRWRRREVQECRRRGLRGWLWGQRKGVRECLLGWAVSNGQIRIGSRTQYSRN